MSQTHEKERPLRALTPLFCCLALVLMVFLLMKLPSLSHSHRAVDDLGDAWSLRLVSSRSPLPDSFPEPELTTLSGGQQVDARIYSSLIDLLDSAQDSGLSPIICSAYRSHQDQQTLFSDKVQEYLDQGLSQKNAEAQAAAWVAVPGTSEHETGLALDIVDPDYQLLDENQADTPTQQWLLAHAWEYGFVLRYPQDKPALTGIDYEPWHYRYVGKEAAEIMYRQGLCLEEYLLKYAPDVMAVG